MKSDPVVYVVLLSMKTNITAWDVLRVKRKHQAKMNSIESFNLQQPPYQHSFIVGTSWSKSWWRNHVDCLGVRSEVRVGCDECWHISRKLCENAGPWAEDISYLINRTRTLLMKESGVLCTKQFLCQILSLTIHRGKATIILGTLPNSLPIQLELIVDNV